MVFSGKGSDFTSEPYKQGDGTWYPTYSYGYGSRWVSGWSFQPDKSATANSQSTGDSEKVVVTKKPKPVLGATQAVAEAGDTIPIVFGIRVNNIGGIWVQPALVKTGSTAFVSVNVFAISQGYVPDSLTADDIWVGNRNMKYAIDASPLIALNYVDSATSQAAPSVCPLSFSSAGSNRIFCDYDVFSFAGNTLTTSGGTVRRPDIENNYYYLSEFTKGEGDLDNSVIRYNNSDIEVYDSLTGNDVTAAYWSYLGINPVGTYSYANAKYSGSTIIGGWDLATVRNVVGSVASLASPTGAVPYSTGPVVFNYGTGTLNKQINTSLPADTGTLYGVVQEWRVSPYQTPTSPPTTKDFTNYSDVTWLSIQKDLWDPNSNNTYVPFAAENIPTDFKQLSVFFLAGVEVDLYSVGLVGGVYLHGPSSSFVDLAMYMFTLMKRANGISTDSLAAPIDTDNMSYLSSFNDTEGMFFNGIIDQSVNVIEYITKTAPCFFLSFISSGGQYKLNPSLPTAIVSSNVTIDTGSQASTTYIVFDESTILPGSFQKKYFNAEERRPVCISVLWRDADPANVSQQRTSTVRYPETASDAPTVQFDMTDFCTTSAHAAKYAKYELARRRYSTHAISFATQLDDIFVLEPTEIIKVQRQRINSTGDNRTEIGHYQITKITHTGEGVTLVEASYFPLNASNIYTINNEIVNGTFTIT